MEEKTKSSKKRWSDEEIKHLLSMYMTNGRKVGIELFLVSYPERTFAAAKTKLSKLIAEERERIVAEEYKLEERNIIRRITNFFKRLFRR